MVKTKKSENDEQKSRVLFEQAFAEELNELDRVIRVRKKAEAFEEKARENILSAMKSCKLTDFKNGRIHIRITRAKDGYCTIDVSKLREENIDLFNVLIKTYPKQIKGRDESVWVKILEKSDD